MFADPNIDIKRSQIDQTYVWRPFLGRIVRVDHAILKSEKAWEATKWPKQTVFARDLRKTTVFVAFFWYADKYLNTYTYTHKPRIIVFSFYSKNCVFKPFGGLPGLSRCQNRDPRENSVLTQVSKSMFD